MDPATEEKLKKLFVGGLNRNTTDETLKEYFGAYGEITDCVVICDAEKKSRGFGYVTFERADVTTEILNIKRDLGHTIDDKAVEVKRAIPREDQSSTAHLKTTKVFIGGIPPEADEEDVKSALLEQGKLSSNNITIDLIKHKDSDKHRGFCFGELDNEDDVDTLCCVKKIDIKGKKVEVKKAEPKGKSGEMGGRGGRGGRGGFRGGRGGGSYSNNYQQSYNVGGGGGYDQGFGVGGYGGYNAGYQDAYATSSYPAYGATTGYLSTGYGDNYGSMGMYSQAASTYGPSRGGAGAGRGGGRYRPY